MNNKRKKNVDEKDCNNTINKKICYKIDNKRKNDFDKKDCNKKIKSHHEECKDYNCYDFYMNYNRFHNGNISYKNYIK
jgi:hypothetical protein